MVGDAVNGVGGDPGGGAGHEQDFHAGGDAFQLAVAVVVLSVGGLVGNANGEQG